MDIPAKKLVRLLAADQPAEVRAAAVRVAAELGVKDAAADILARLDDPDDAVRLAALSAAGKLKLAKALPTLLARIKRGGDEAKLAADAAAALGPAGVSGLQDLLTHVVPGVRRYIAAALGQAAGGVAVVLDKDPQVSAAAANAVMAKLPALTPKERTELAGELVKAASDKKASRPAATELQLVRVLAALHDPAAAPALWDRTQPPHAPDVRAAALQAIVAGNLAPAAKDQWKKLFSAAGDSHFPIVAPALMMLSRLPADKHQAEWLALLHAPDVAARTEAIKKVGDRDTADTAAALMDQLSHPDKALQEAARAALVKLSHGRAALAAAVTAAKTVEETWAACRAVAPFAAELSAATRKELFDTCAAHILADDHKADPLMFLLRAADAAALRDQLHELAVARRKKKDYATAVKYLKPVVRDPGVGFPVRLELALCGLKLSDKDTAPDRRATDPCLRQFEHALTADADATLADVLAAKWIDDEDRYYLGFHFVERHGADQAFGAAILAAVAKAGGRSKLATQAKSKLKSAGL